MPGRQHIKESDEINYASIEGGTPQEVTESSLDEVMLLKYIEEGYTLQQACDIWFNLKQNNSSKVICPPMDTAQETWRKREAQKLGINLYMTDDSSSGSSDDLDKTLAFLYLIKNQPVPEELRKKIIRREPQLKPLQKTSFTEDLIKFTVHLIHSLMDKYTLPYAGVSSIFYQTGYWDKLSNPETAAQALKRGIPEELSRFHIHLMNNDPSVQKDGVTFMAETVAEAINRFNLTFDEVSELLEELGQWDMLINDLYTFMLSASEAENPIIKALAERLNR